MFMVKLKVNFSRSDDPLKQIEECLEILGQIDILVQDKKEIEIDFSDVEWILPCSALLFAGKVDEMKKENVEVNLISPKKKTVEEYLLGIGFPFGTKKQGDTYHPINHFGKDSSINKGVNELLDNMNNKIPEQFGVSVSYLLGELTDNIEQHSQFTHASIMAQYFSQKKYIDIGILDNGLTIPGVFENNKISFSEDSDAILKAISGTTTKKEDGTRGFGLHSTKQIVRDLCNGELHLISRKGALIFEPNLLAKKYNFIQNPLKGTLIYIRIKTPSKHLNIYPYLE